MHDSGVPRQAPAWSPSLSVTVHGAPAFLPAHEA